MSSAFRQALESGDLDALRRQWAAAFPGMPQPETREQAEIVMHHARTQAGSMPLRVRAWSHRWLTERGLPSGLPDELRPRAERLYPIVVEAVGIAVKAANPALKPVADEVRRAMEGAVADAYAEGRTDPAFVKARMAEAREGAMKRLLGRISGQEKR